MKRKALGKGLSALIPEIDAPVVVPNEIDIDQIAPNPDQPRFKLEESRTEELAASIRENGVLQPVLVRPLGNRYHSVKALVAEGKLSAGHARALLASNASSAEMTRIAHTIVERSWSVREAEQW